MTALVVVAKACIPGRVKTRLSPPFSLEEAAEIAAASLADTLATVASLAARRILYFDGDPDGTCPAGFEVIPQRQGSLDERIAALFDILDEPTLLIGMDTPQVRVTDLVWPVETDAVIGMAADGGFWMLGMRQPCGDVVRGVPMSRADTGALQRAALERAGLSVREASVLRDVDEAGDAQEVAALVPQSRFARAVAAASARRSAA